MSWSLCSEKWETCEIGAILNRVTNSLLLAEPMHRTDFNPSLKYLLSRTIGIFNKILVHFWINMRWDLCSEKFETCEIKAILYSVEFFLVMCRPMHRRRCNPFNQPPTWHHTPQITVKHEQHTDLCIVKNETLCLNDLEQVAVETEYYYKISD